MDTLYNILVSSHSGFRWLLLLALAISIALSLSKGFISKNSSFKQGKPIYLITLILSHFQLIFGLVLYFISPKVVFSASSMKEKYYRFFLVEHITLMIIAIVLITIGYSKSKANLSSPSGQKRLFTFYTIALLLILFAIPWPWQPFGAGWF